MNGPKTTAEASAETMVETPSLAALPTHQAVPTDPTAWPRGFRFAGGHCGIKRTRDDLGILLSDSPASVAGCFTRNPVRAPCVDRNADLVPRPDCRAVVVNSGNANALGGAQGIAANVQMAEASAAALGCAPEHVLTLSTGMIGVPLAVRRIAKALPKLVEDLAPNPMPFAGAIVTTDTCTKVAWLQVVLPGDDEPVTLLGIAKGSGMIHPDMATTLGFVCTDAGVAPARLQHLLRETIGDTFNAISVDGDTSTNDSVLVLANGASGRYVEGAARIECFREALRRVLLSLAIQVARDGEGATRLLRVEVAGAADHASARALARGICRGNLFKCSVFAGQPDWGRLAAAAGQAALEHGISLAPDQWTIEAQGVRLVEQGRPCDDVPRETLLRRLRQPEVHWSLSIGEGPGHFTAYGCDFSYDYVRINADEALQVEVSPTGTVQRNLSLAAYSPRLKHQLLVDGLAYVRRFLGMRALIYLHGTGARRFDLVASLAQDLELALDAALKPLVVVPDEHVADIVMRHMNQTGHYGAKVPPDAAVIDRLLDRKHLCVLVEGAPEPGDVVDLAIRLGMQKLIALGDAQGLHDRGGLVSQLSPESVLAGIDRGRFESSLPEFLTLARQASVRGVPALHLIDGRVPHALVGELFTDQGIGTLITRLAV